MAERSLVYHFEEPVWYKTIYPYFWHPIKGIFLSATIFTVVAVSAERYRAVCHPLSRRHVSLYTKHNFLIIRIVKHFDISSDIMTSIDF